MKVIPSSKADDLPELTPGDMVAGRFRIVEIIGSGGFSVVYRAHQEGMNRFVALKVLKPTASADDSIVERFRREALFASQLSHPNTITLFDYGQTEQRLCYIAMEYLVGHDLSEELKYHEPIEPKRVWSIVSQICRSLSEAHRIGLIHRDLKPENIFLVEQNDREFVKVLDFGVSKALSDFGAADATSLAPLTQEGTVFGTPLYMAPEQAMAEELTPAVDVFALGHMTYEMLTGKAKYAGETSPMDVMLQQINEPPLELPEPWSETPFSALVREATRKDPLQRIGDAGDLLSGMMSEEFLPFMDTGELSAGLQNHSDNRPLLELPVGSRAVEQTQNSERVYRWELSELEETLETVRDEGQMRLVVIRGAPGTGRSNLLRAFLKRHRGEAGIQIVHRQGFLEGRTIDAGLEADLAEAAGVELQGQGIGEVNRLLGEILSDADLPTLSELKPLDTDSDPLSRLASRRDDFFTRLIEPFRRAAQRGTLVWGIEDLENVDPMTLAFLERIIREMRIHPAPVMLVTTVHADGLVRRPGLMRYAEEIINAPSTYARHLRLIEPGDGAEEEYDEQQKLTQLAEISSDAAVDGSYSGITPSVPESFGVDDEAERWAAMADGQDVDDEAERWAAMADGQDVDDGDESAPSEDDAQSTEGHTDRAEARGPVDTGPTQRLELFTTEDATSGNFDSADPEIYEAFDTVMGYLAQLDERVVSRELWEFIYHRVLPFETTRLMGVILEYAERFGIVTLSDEAIAFTDRQFAASLRETFEEEAESVEAHAELAELLSDYAPDPGREDVRRIVHHSVKGEEYRRAVDLLLRSGDEAYGSQDLDLAREYYLQFQSLIEELMTHSPPPEVAQKTYPKDWLRIGEIQGALGEHGAAEDALQRAIRESQSDDHRIMAGAHKLLGDLAMTQERYEYARECFESASQRYQKTSLARPFVAAMGEIGRCSVQLGAPRRAEGTLLQALDNAQKLQDRPLQARIHRYMGEVLTRQARFLEAVDHLEEAMGIFEEHNEHRSVVSCLNELGRAHYAAGQFAESRDHYTRALARLSTRHLQLERSPHLGLARALAALNNLEQAEVHLVEAMSHYSTRNQPIQRARVQFHLGDLYLATERPVLADEHYEHVFEVGERVGHRDLAFDALIRRAYAAYDNGDTDTCFEFLQRAVDYGNETDDRESALVARAHIIYVQLLMCDFDADGEMFSTLLRETDERTLHPSHILCDLFRADVAVARNAYREAQNLLAKTRRQVAGLGEYGLFIPIARREYLVGQQLGRLDDPHTGSGYALGTLIPPESDGRHFDAGRFL